MTFASLKHLPKDRAADVLQAIANTFVPTIEDVEVPQRVREMLADLKGELGIHADDDSVSARVKILAAINLELQELDLATADEGASVRRLRDRGIDVEASDLIEIPERVLRTASVSREVILQTLASPEKKWAIPKGATFFLRRFKEKTGESVVVAAVGLDPNREEYVELARRVFDVPPDASPIDALRRLIETVGLQFQLESAFTSPRLFMENEAILPQSPASAGLHVLNPLNHAFSAYQFIANTAVQARHVYLAFVIDDDAYGRYVRMRGRR